MPDSRNGTPNEMKKVESVPQLSMLGPRADASRYVYLGVRRGAALDRAPPSKWKPFLSDAHMGPRRPPGSSADPGPSGPGELGRLSGRR